MVVEEFVQIPQNIYVVCSKSCDNFLIFSISIRYGYMSSIYITPFIFLVLQGVTCVGATLLS